MTNPNINSTAWLDREAGPSSGIDSGSPPVWASDIGAFQLELLAKLEALLVESQRAVLSRDLSRLEQLSEQQAEVFRSLSAFPARDTVRRTDAPSPTPLIQDGLLAARRRVLLLGRIQQLLLARAQASLRVISNRMAGPHAGYEPVCGPTGLALRPTSVRPVQRRSEEA